MQPISAHQYIDRATSRIETEELFCDRILNIIYSNAREDSATLYRALSSARFSELLAFLNFDILLSSRFTGVDRLANKMGLDFSECVDTVESLNSPRKIFERKIRYWETRPMPKDPAVVVSPADSRMLLGSLAKDSLLFLKEKFFHFVELFGEDKTDWLEAFEKGDFAVFRLTPEKYHYNHTPVAGEVLDIYQLIGNYHSCNPTAVVALATPYSKNKRVVTVIDTDVSRGTQVGLVAMIEIVALMIGDIAQCYSESRYDHPQDVKKGMFLRKGQPKSLYRPGSSVDVLLFQRGRVEFSQDIVKNMHHQNVNSRFSKGFGKALVETDVKVRSQIGKAIT
jgi:phosphatidylserine decarboxylase